MKLSNLLALALLSVTVHVHAAAPNVASCPSAVPGTAMPAGTFLACTPAAVFVQATPTTVVASLVGGVPKWSTAGSLAQVDQVWGDIVQPNTTNHWWPVSLMGWTTAPPAGTHSATLTWNPVTKDTAGVALPAAPVYNLYRGASSTTLGLVASKVSPPYKNTGIADGTYVWAVSALCADATVCIEGAKSALSPAVTFKPAGSATPVTCAAPAAAPTVAPTP